MQKLVYAAILTNKISHIQHVAGAFDKLLERIAAEQEISGRQRDRK